ncbi:hypothetical protein [uncultured Duncaniella sp.]|uniref:hypothetical protein n=1 Tax=uncultured Duncaniella sp. TaxID=2768039 RepID=UPI0025E9D039|nr:hypothetical protein [uncultured Duncaniella sp.]
MCQEQGVEGRLPFGCGGKELSGYAVGEDCMGRVWSLVHDSFGTVKVSVEAVATSASG